jgi:DNA modification methylase
MSIQLDRGDCLSIMPSIADASVDLVLADLPYGTTANKWDSVLPLDELWSLYKKKIRPGAPIVLTCQQPFTTMLAASNLGWLKTEWIWEKPQGTGFLNANRYPMKSHENILVFCERMPPYYPQKNTGFRPYQTSGQRRQTENYGSFKEQPSLNPDGTRYPKTVLRFNSERGFHPTQKPVALMEYLIRTYTQPGADVLDNCMGSGTTGVACVTTGRQFIGIERDEADYETASRRIVKAQEEAAA